MNRNPHILWVDDEVDSLRSLVVSLETNDFRVSPVTNGDDAIEIIRRGGVDLVFLDEMMAGLNGVDTLRAIREIIPDLPVVMVTKVEEEDLMNRAYGSRADDFLIKPVRPRQILAVAKKFLQSEKIFGDRLRKEYAQEMAQVLGRIAMGPGPAEWVEAAIWFFRRQMELEDLGDAALLSTHADARREANREFFRSVASDYPDWLTIDDSPALFSHQVIDDIVVPLLRDSKQVLYLVLDCVRADQWMTLERALRSDFAIETRYGLSIVPSATPYSRNALFAGMLPAQIRETYPDWWEDDHGSESSMNRFEGEMLREAIRRRRLDCPVRYERVDGKRGRDLADRLASFADVPLIGAVFGFIDVLAHERGDSRVLREMIPTEGAYRDLTGAWFGHSPLAYLLRAAGRAGRTVVITSDHGARAVNRSAVVIGDRTTTTSIRYKVGRNIRCDRRQAVDVREPKTWGLPAPGINTNYLISGEDYFFVYPNEQRRYERRLSGSYQHGGISLEEMVVPVAVLVPR